MPILGQIIDLLSSFPGSLIYHLSVLFAIEATLGIALPQRHRPATRRVVLAAIGMLVGRLALMVVALLDQQGMIAVPAAVLPPLERAVDAIGVWLMVWALLPLFDNMPQWGDLVAGGVSLLLVVLYFFLAVAWHSEAVAGAVYNGSAQETVWEVIQLGVLGAATVYTLLERRGDWGLVLGILVVLLAAHSIHFGWPPVGENVAGWERLGQLVAYLLFAVSVYRLLIRQIMAQAAPPLGEQMAGLVEQAMRLGAVGTDASNAARTAVSTIAALTEASTVAMLTLAAERAEGYEVELVSFHSNGKLTPRPPKVFALDDAPALRRAINHKQALFLRPGGVDDASRLVLLMQLLPEADHDERLRSAVLIQPIHHEGQLFGALLVQPTAGGGEWPASKRWLLGSLADQLAAALSQARSVQRLQEKITQLNTQLAAADSESDGRIARLQAELESRHRTEQELSRRLDEAQRETERAYRDAQDLATLLEDRSVPFEDFEDRDEELSLAVIQEQVGALAAELQEQASGHSGAPGHEMVMDAALSEQIRLVALELRQPMTSISGYTDLLLNESVGSIGELQRMFLQRVKVSSERARVMLDELVQVLTRNGDRSDFELESVDAAEIIHNVADQLGPEVEDRQIDLQLGIDPALPLLEIDPETSGQIIRHLLMNAILASRPGGRVALQASYRADEPKDRLHDERGRGYLFVSVHDSGPGVAVEDQLHVFDRNYRAEHPQITGLGESEMGLPLVQELVQAWSGRVWIESSTQGGSTISMVLPVVTA